jgi:hypothetical protein
LEIGTSLLSLSFSSHVEEEEIMILKPAACERGKGKGGILF